MWLSLQQGRERAGGVRRTGRWVPPSVSGWDYRLTTPPLVHGAVQTGPQVAMSSWHLFLYSLSPGAFILGSHTECIPLTATSQMSFFSLMCFPNSFSVTVINSNTPSLKCQSKLHQDLRRTIVHLYALSINLNYQLSHYMPTIKQWHTQRLYSTLI